MSIIMRFKLSFLFYVLSLERAMVCEAVGLDPRVWKGFTEEISTIKPDKTLEAVYTIFFWPEFTKWMPYNIRLPSLELIHKDITLASKRGSYICSEEARMSTSIEFVQTEVSNTDKLEITYVGSLTPLYVELKLFGKGYEFDENNEVSVNIWFTQKVILSIATKIFYPTEELTSPPTCLFTILDITVHALPSATVGSIKDNWVSWTPGVQKSDAKEMYTKFLENVSMDELKTMIRVGLMKAMKERADNDDSDWVCLSEEFKEKVKADESHWKYSKEYSLYCSNLIETGSCGG